MGMIEAGTVDILFGNEDEVRHLTGCGDFAECVEALSKNVATLVITRGAHGAVAVERDYIVEVPAAPVDRIVDTTGAGDLFAAGFLAGALPRAPAPGLPRNWRNAAAEVISHFGARPEADLRELAGL